MSPKMTENRTFEEHVVTEYEEERVGGGGGGRGEKGRMRATRDTMFESTIVSG
jgi:hypothetical protein